MANIAPFKGIKYNLKLIKDVNSVVTQPYDKITKEMQENYYEKSEYNYVRLILGREKDRYTESFANYKKWLENGILVQTEAPAIYPYYQEFEIDGVRKLRRGFIAVCELEDFEKGGILPHERTLSKPKEDRLKLIRTTQKNFEQIFMLYSDREDRINNLLKDKTELEPPELIAEDEYGTVHKMWTVKDREMIKSVKDIMREKVLVIADGHHRYETSLNYRNLRRKELGSWTGKEAFNYRMMSFFNTYDKGLVILPTHRLVFNIKDFDQLELLYKIAEFFYLYRVDRDKLKEKLTEEPKHSFGFYSQGEAYILKLINPETIDRFVGGEKSEEYKNLDVTVLHSIIIENILSIDPKNIEGYVRYERDVSTAMDRVDKGEFQMCFIMNPTKPEEVESIARNRERMPQKSTDFFPKLISGLVLFDIADGEYIELE